MTPSVTITLTGNDAAAVSTPLLFVALPSGAALPAALQRLNEAAGGAIQAALDTKDFRGSRDEILYLTGVASGPRRIALIGTGTSPLTPQAVRRAAAIATRHALKLGTGEVAFFADAMTPDQIEWATVGLHAGGWQYLDTKTPPPEAEQKKPLSAAILLVPENPTNTASLEAGNAIGVGQSLARTLGMMPGNICTPDFLADTAKQVADRHHMRLTVLTRSDMQREGMGSFLAVAQGTPQDPKLVTMEYRGGKTDDPPVVLVGKGLCFDSGGISIKPAPNMEWMKFDMCGAAGVIGAMETIARLKLRINVVGAFGATTNMPSGTAVNPGDVVRSHLGKYIEIVNTDAEGRLVLADVLSYVRRFKPAVVIDAATLTGAIVIALGGNVAGIFGNDQKVVAEVLQAGERASERGWELPMVEEYKELIRSDVADVKNSGGRMAGSITAALFLQEFASGYPWIHMDIAGTAYSESDLVWAPKGPTGAPVGTFVEFVRARAAQ